MRREGVRGQGHQPLLGPAFGDRIVDLDEVRGFPLQESVQLVVEAVLGHGDADVAGVARRLPILEVQPLHVQVGEAHDLREVQRLPTVLFPSLPKLRDSDLLAGAVDLGRHEQDFAFQRLAPIKQN